MLDTSNYSILWTVPNNPYDVMGAWVPHVGDGQWLSGIQHMTPNKFWCWQFYDLILQYRTYAGL